MVLFLVFVNSRAGNGLGAGGLKTGAAAAHQPAQPLEVVRMERLGRFRHGVDLVQSLADGIQLNLEILGLTRQRAFFVVRIGPAV